MVGAAEQVALPQAELVAGQELAAAGGAAEALQVVDVVAGAHHQVAAAERRPALGALDAEEPAVISLAVGLAVAQEACAGLVQGLPALGALEAGDVPFQVRRYPQQEGVLDAAPAARAQGQPRPPCRERAEYGQGQRYTRAEASN